MSIKYKKDENKDSEAKTTNGERKCSLSHVRLAIATDGHVA